MTQPTSEKVLFVRIPDHLHVALRARARAEDRSLSSLTRQALLTYVGAEVRDEVAV